MTARGQRQKAGGGSRQVQVDTLNIFQGVTEDRAVAISREQASIVVRELTEEAREEAIRRIENLERKLTLELADKDLLEAFADPAFQVLLRKTHLHAASTPEDVDHEMLSKLLVEHAKQPVKPVRMVVSRAVEVIEQIDTVALAGLTAIFVISYSRVMHPDPKVGLRVIDGLLSKLFDDIKLPSVSDSAWVQRLALMDCINVHTGIPLIKWHGFLAQLMPGYLSAGVVPNNLPEFRNRLDGVLPGLSEELVPHAFRPKFFRINTTSSADFEDKISDSICDEKKFELKNILHDARVDRVNSDATQNMLRYIGWELGSLDRTRYWWDSIESGISITPVGVAIAYSNTKRFDELSDFRQLSELINP